MAQIKCWLYVARKIEKTIDNVIEPLRDNPMASAGEEAVLVGGVEVLRTYFNDMEQFQGKVKKKLVETEFNQASFQPTHYTVMLSMRLIKRLQEYISGELLPSKCNP